MASAATTLALGLLVVAPAAEAAEAAEAAAEPPLNVVLPAVVGTARAGEVVGCSTGAWSGAPTSYDVGWVRDGWPLPDSASVQRALGDADVGHAIACRVRATNEVGTSGWATGATVTVEAAADPGSTLPPENVDPPSVVGTARSGRRLTCDPGTWRNRPTLTIAWRSGGTVLGTGASYDVAPADVGRALVCTVRAVNAGGTSTASSSPVTVTTGDPAVLPPAEPTDACQGRASVVVGGGAEWSRRRVVRLRVRTPAGAQRIEVADNPDFRGAVRRRLEEDCTYPWRLTGPSGAPQAVYVRFPGAADPAIVVQDRIRLDDSAPVVTKAHARWSNRRGGWVLTVRAQDIGAGLMWFQAARPDGTVRRTHPVGDEVVSWDRSVISRVRFADRLGNRTGWVRVQFLA